MSQRVSVSIEKSHLPARRGMFASGAAAVFSMRPSAKRSTTTKLHNAPAWAALCLPAVFAAAITPGALAQTAAKQPAQLPQTLAQSRSSDPLARAHAWSSAGNGTTNDHFSPFETVLNPVTVSGLAPRWVFTASAEVDGTPTVDGDSVYASDAGGSVWRVDARTGKAI